MKTLRYRTWRRSIALGSAPIMLSFVGPIFFRAEWFAMACEILFWAAVVGFAGFHLAVALLRRIGILEFSYTDADRNSYLYNAEPLHRQMKDCRRQKERD